jgi:hypothetical protein
LHFLVEGSSHFTPGEISFRRGRSARFRRIFNRNHSSLSRPGRDAAGRGVKPIRYRLPRANRVRQSRQAQEYCLKDVVGIGSIADQAPSGTEHHWPVPVEQNLERPLVVRVNELPQKMRVRLARGLTRHSAQAVYQGPNGELGHIG